MFEAIEEEDRVVENEDGGNPALLGSCNDRAKQLHASPSGLRNCTSNVLINQLFVIFMLLRNHSLYLMLLCLCNFFYHMKTYYCSQIFHKYKG